MKIKISVEFNNEKKKNFFNVSAKDGMDPSVMANIIECLRSSSEPLAVGEYEGEYNPQYYELKITKALVEC